MNNLNNLSVSIPSPGDPFAFDVKHYQHQHRQQESPPVTPIIHSNRGTSSLGLSSRLHKLQILVKNCSTIIEDRQEKNIREAASWAPLVPSPAEKADDSQLFVENVTLKEENVVLRQALTALRDVLFIEIGQREYLSKQCTKLQARLACANQRKPFHTKRVQQRENAKQLVSRNRFELEKTLHYQLEPAQKNCSNDRSEPPILFRFHR